MGADIATYVQEVKCFRFPCSVQSRSRASHRLLYLREKVGFIRTNILDIVADDVSGNVLKNKTIRALFCGL